jgi:SWIM zinc finger
MTSRRNSEVGAATMAIGRLVGECSDPTRFLRGADLLQQGMVSELTISEGRVQGAVRGSRSTPYQAVMISSAGETLPTSTSQLRFNCTCPDWGDPCKHAVALALALAERLDDDVDLRSRFLGHQPGPIDRRRTEVDGDEVVVSLPTTPPMWATNIIRRAAPIDAKGFFGSALPPLPALPGPTETSAERMRALGPLIVDRYDLAPDLLRLLQIVTDGSTLNDA